MGVAIQEERNKLKSYWKILQCKHVKLQLDVRFHIRSVCRIKNVIEVGEALSLAKYYNCKGVKKATP
jgi:hypothetical protein